MTKNLRLSIITVNYNGLHHTCEFIRSVQSARLSLSYELIVVDNGSSVDEACLIQEEFPSVTAIRSKKNLGFAGGNNLGIEISKGDFLYFLNNDTLLSDNAAHEIKLMVDFLENNTQAGAISPKIKFADQNDLIQFAGSTPLSQITLRNYQIGYKHTDNPIYDQLIQIPYLHGAAMLVKQEVIQKIGTIPECYFLYYEELDWSCLISRKYDLYYFPNSTVFHKESSTTGLDSPLKAYYLSRNRLLFAHRNRKGWIRIFSKTYLFFIVTPRNAIKYLLKGRFRQAYAVVRGVFSYLLLKDK